MPPRSVYGSEEEWGRWVEASGELTVNAWIRRALNEAAELDLALAREVEEKEAA